LFNLTVEIGEYQLILHEDEHLKKILNLVVNREAPKSTNRLGFQPLIILALFKIKHFYLLNLGLEMPF